MRRRRPSVAGSRPSSPARFCCSPRIEALCAAIATHQLAGGDLAELPRRFAAAAAERERSVAEARPATAQARFTGLLVVAMPLGAAALGELADPGFVGAMLRN